LIADAQNTIEKLNEVSAEKNSLALTCAEHEASLAVDQTIIEEQKAAALYSITY
jgi:hypothetical protein